jgi:hypothetical protein
MSPVVTLSPLRPAHTQPAFCDCQVWDHLIVGPAVGRVMGEGVPDRIGEVVKRLDRVQPHHVLTEPGRPREAASEL